ncbi:DUF4124 domain-containing protein [Hydrogenophaga sp. BPS33]|uniref:DUF4124 domain-containing protein n=1 Tax=Hydrogenophaga sp. BPS33 TaxID=2651974 RepID=UPI00131FA1D3|nr:DUF4124 domain-containing protein [Hydrogenophaga sp. BPS33]QHE86189.1 DUF4124 domain-containing protein [Hydrogenophaga sp. BPS33]
MLQKTTFSPLWRALALTGLLLTSSVSALAQWQWVDDGGRKVFSDTAPPASVPERNILKRPNGAPAAPRVAAPAAQDDKAASNPTPQAPTVDKELEARKKQAEQAEEAKQKAEEQRVAKARSDNCERARKAKAAIDSGVRLATTNAKGEREIMDDKARAAESRRLDEIVRSDCGPMPRPTAQSAVQ